MSTTLAPESQTWWDAFCNLSPDPYILPISEKIVSSKQYNEYAETEFGHNRNTDLVLLSNLTLEDASTYFLFMHYAFDPQDFQEI